MVTIFHGEWSLESKRILRILERLALATGFRVDVVQVPFMGPSAITVPTVRIGTRTLVRPSDAELATAVATWFASS